MNTMMSTMPIIAYDIEMLNRYTSNPSTQQWHVLTKYKDLFRSPL